MPDMMLEQWIKDFEAKFNNVDNVNSKSFIQTSLIYDLRNKSQCLGIEKFKTKSGIEEIIYCYIPSKQQGLILKREYDKTGSIVSYVSYVSYGDISLDKFITNHPSYNQNKKSKIKKYAIPTFIGTIIPVTYIGFKKFFGKDKN